MTVPGEAPPREDQLGTDEIREVAILLLAADGLICEDFKTAEDAVSWSRRLADVVDTDPMWRDGGHRGDCTKDIHTCARCVLNGFIDKARELEAVS